jgi:hypothetical protein
LNKNIEKKLLCIELRGESRLTVKKLVKKIQKQFLVILSTYCCRSFFHVSSILNFQFEKNQVIRNSDVKIGVIKSRKKNDN